MNIIKTLLLLIITSNVMAQVDPINSEGLAVGGYDVVSYFKEGKAIKGKSSYTSKFGSGVYYFSQEENKALFERNPSKYIPQFDGFCALAISYGKKISIDPETFKVVNEKLYLFYNGNTSNGKVNSLTTWNKNETKLLRKAEELWPDVKRKTYKSGDKL